MLIKKLNIIVLILIISSFNAFAQELIRNSGFEGAWSCPEGFTKLPVKELIPHWKNPNKGTPDYFHECGDAEAGIPSNFAGTIPPHEGSAYIGLILREVFNDSSKYDEASREYITIELDEKLEHRQLYCFSLYYALASKSRFAVDALGISFTSAQPKSWDAGLIDMEPLVYNIPGHYMENKNEWHELCGVFRARGNEKYLTIGNFNPNVKTHFENLSDSLADSSFVYAYYYIDDVNLYKIENTFECGCQDNLSQGYDWLNDDSESYLEAYNNYIQNKNQLLADAMQDNPGNQDKNFNDINNKQNSQNNSENDNSQSGNGNKNSSSENNKSDNLDSNNENSGDVNTSSDKQGELNKNNESSGNMDDQNEEKDKDSGDEDNYDINSDNKDSIKYTDNKNNDNSDKNPEKLNYKSISGQIRNAELNDKDKNLINSLRDASSGFSINMPNIYFAFNQSELLPSSYPALEELLNILKKEKNLSIEIRGHTDNVGSNRYNKKLSIARAESVYNFLINSGIDKSRLKYRGFGNKVPIATNETEAGRQQNRRVEIKVISN